MEDPDEKGWGAIILEQNAGADAVDDAGRAELSRCAAIVKKEIEDGRSRAIPMTSGVMVVLHRILGAIENG